MYIDDMQISPQGKKKKRRFEYCRNISVGNSG